MFFCHLIAPRCLYLLVNRTCRKFRKESWETKNILLFAKIPWNTKFMVLSQKLPNLEHFLTNGIFNYWSEGSMVIRRLEIVYRKMTKWLILTQHFGATKYSEKQRNFVKIMIFMFLKRFSVQDEFFVIFSNSNLIFGNHTSPDKKMLLPVGKREGSNPNEFDDLSKQLSLFGVRNKSIHFTFFHTKNKFHS